MSNQAVGSNSRIIYGLEDSLGAGAAVPNGLFLYYKGGESFGAETAENDSDTMRNNPNPTESASGNTTVKGGFQFELAWQHALLMALHFGSVTSGAAVGGVKFNQYVARLHALPVAHGNDAQDAGLQRLDHLALEDVPRTH